MNIRKPYTMSFNNPLDTVSFGFLALLLFLSPFKWLPGISVNELQNIKHLILAFYIILRIGCHLSIKEVSLPWNLTTILPIFLAVFFSTGLHSGAQIGLLLDYILVFVFAYVLIIHFSETIFTRSHLKVLMYTYILSVTLISAYSLVSSLMPLTAFPLPSEIRPYADPYSALGFSTGPNDYTTSVSVALSISLLKINQTVIFKITSFVLFCGLIWAVYASGWHGRAGLLIPLLALVILSVRKTALVKLVPLGVISPILLYFTIFLYTSIFGITDIIIRFNEFLSGRLAIYHSSFNILSEQPLGVGFGNFTEYFQAPTWDVFSRPPSGVHNVFLGISVEVGLIAGLIMLFWIIAVSRTATQNIVAVDRISELSASIIVIGVLSVGLAVGRMSPFNIYNLTIWWVCFAGVLNRPR